jgi:hypothetical protein
MEIKDLLARFTSLRSRFAREVREVVRAGGNTDLNGTMAKR